MKLRSQAEMWEGKTGSLSTILEYVSVGEVCSKGGLPTASSQASMPTPQMSIVPSQTCPCTISGARQSRVPQTVPRRVRLQTAQPKSAIFTLPSPTSMFSGLRSRWMMSRACRCARAAQTCRSTTATCCSEKLPASLSSPQSSPRGANSRMRQTAWESQKQPKSLSRCGWLTEDWITISRLTCSVKLPSASSFRPMRLRATMQSEAFSRANTTSPNLPRPRLRSTSKSERVHSECELLLPRQRLRIIILCVSRRNPSQLQW